MFERILERGERIGRRRARALAWRMAERIAAELPREIAAEASDEGVRLSGRRIRTRFALEPGLRWLIARMKA